MYSTRRVNPRTAEGFLSIGDAYEKPSHTSARFRGRQFQTIPPKTGQLEGYFGEFKYSTDNYQDTNGYRVIQPRDRRRLGFGSLDAHKRDEFTLHVRAQQWKELLKGEHAQTIKRLKDENDVKSRSLPLSALAASGAETAGSARSGVIDAAYSAAASAREHGAASSARSSTSFAATGEGKVMFQTMVPTSLYDIGKEKANGVTPICNKCQRDTFYCKHRVGATAAVTARRLGGVRTTAQVYGGTEQTLAKPPHGRKSGIKEFYDAGHLKAHGPPDAP